MSPAPQRRRPAKPASKRRGIVKTAPKGRRTAPSVDIQVQSRLWKAQVGAVETVRDAIAAAAAAASTSGGEVSILLTDDSAVRALNREWRRIDKPTNVLSFPPPKSGPKTAVTGDTRFLGDIVIAYETLHRECVDEKRDFLHHLAHLTVHGFLHLLGYDHATDAQADAMERLEGRIMARMKLPDPYLAHPIGGA